MARIRTGRPTGRARRAGVPCRDVTGALEIDVVEGDRDTLVAAFLGGTLAPDDLPLLRFRVDPAEEWREHPQVAFLALPIAPAILLDDDPDLVWQQHVTGSPCGVLHVWHRFSRGWKVESHLGRAAAPDVASTIAYDLVLAVMAGDLTPISALERGAEVEGDMATMQRLVRVFDQPEFVAATREAIGPLGPALRAAAPRRRP
jgi:hypothetical protein